MIIDRRNCCCFFPVDIAGYEKWHLVVAIFCSQKNKPQLFCIECCVCLIDVITFTSFFFWWDGLHPKNLQGLLFLIASITIKATTASGMFFIKKTNTLKWEHDTSLKSDELYSFIKNKTNVMVKYVPFKKREQCHYSTNNLVIRQNNQNHFNFTDLTVIFPLNISCVSWFSQLRIVIFFVLFQS